MQRHELLTRLKALKLYGMASAFEELEAESIRRELPAQVWLTRMLEAESVERQVRSIRYQIGSAKFPLPRDLDTFEFTESPVEEARLRALATAQFMDAQHNLIRSGERAPARPTWPSPWRGPPSAWVKGPASSAWWTWSTSSNRNKPKVRPGASPAGYWAWTPFSATSSAICRSPRMAAPYCSI